MGLQPEKSVKMILKLLSLHYFFRNCLQNHPFGKQLQKMIGQKVSTCIYCTKPAFGASSAQLILELLVHKSYFSRAVKFLERLMRS